MDPPIEEDSKPKHTKATFRAFESNRKSFRNVLAVSIACIVLMYITYQSEEYHHTEPLLDPMLVPFTQDCPKEWRAIERYDYPEPNPDPPKIDLQSKYPSSSKYPPLIGDMSVVVQYDYELGSFTGSPSVLKMQDGTWIASFEVKKIAYSDSPSAWETQIWSSKDRGLHWSYQTSIKGLSRGSLFTVNNEVYILGAGRSNSRIVISKMTNLTTWSKIRIIVDSFFSVQTGNVGVLVTEDKVQTCIKNGRNEDVVIIYAFHKTDDLMNYWRISNIAKDKMRTAEGFIVASLFNIDTRRMVTGEGVLVPYGPKHAQVIMNVDNDEICGLSERYLWNLKTNQLSYLKLTADPGWSIAHGFVIYDKVSNFYWMVSNYPRDNNRKLSSTSIYVPESGRCSIDRSILALYYNKHLSDSWHLAGFVSYSPDFAHHTSDPFMVQDGDDLVFVAKAHLGGPFNETTVNHGRRVCGPNEFSNADATANNHNSNMVIFNRIRNFRKYIHPMMWYGVRDDNPWMD